MLDPIIHQATRLQVLAFLHRNGEASFGELLLVLGLTEGNLGAHADKLQEAGLIETFHALVGLRFEKRYRMTSRGRDAFREYRSALARLLGAEVQG